jgi:SAM-dependent methyltransferase
LLKVKIKKLLDKNSKFDWIESVPSNASILDIGCGNDSGLKIKSVRSDIIYHGVDIADYNLSHSGKEAMDKYFVFREDTFLVELEDLSDEYDGVILSHVLEHVENPYELLTVITKKLKTGGMCFVSFPAIESVNFPKRNWTLNFYDDPTHFNVIDSDSLVAKLSVNYKIERYIKRNYGRWSTRILAIMLDLLSGLFKKNNFLSWYRWGFEVIIRLKKI